jgi:hypothetical protein
MQKDPHINVTRSLPIQGIAESKFVITVAKLSSNDKHHAYVTSKPIKE